MSCDTCDSDMCDGEKCSENNDEDPYDNSRNEMLDTIREVEEEVSEIEDDDERQEEFARRLGEEGITDEDYGSRP
jgi:hypothetical protein